jgi:mannose-6-phosphate isomerase-like protein (cupin superfamily)
MTLSDIEKMISSTPNDYDLGGMIRNDFLNLKLYEERPWGYFEVLLDTPTYKVKRFVVKSGKRLSYQYHKHRCEHWLVVQGIGRLTLNAENKTISANDKIYIERGDYHRAHNIGIEDLVIIETQFGDKCEESDIIRIDDDFNRSTPK